MTENMSENSVDLFLYLCENKSLKLSTIESLKDFGFDSSDTILALDYNKDLPLLTTISLGQRSLLRRLLSDFKGNCDQNDDHIYGDYYCAKNSCKSHLILKQINKLIGFNLQSNHNQLIENNRNLKQLLAQKQSLINKFENQIQIHVEKNKRLEKQVLYHRKVNQLLRNKFQNCLSDNKNDLNKLKNYLIRNSDRIHNHKENVQNNIYLIKTSNQTQTNSQTNQCFTQVKERQNQQKDEDVVQSNVQNQDILQSYVENEDIVESYVENVNIESYVENVNIESYVENEDIVESYVENESIVESYVVNEDIVESYVESEDIVEPYIENEDIVESYVEIENIVESYAENEDIVESNVSKVRDCESNSVPNMISEVSLSIVPIVECNSNDNLNDNNCSHIENSLIKTSDNNNNIFYDCIAINDLSRDSNKRSNESLDLENANKKFKTTDESNVSTNILMISLDSRDESQDMDQNEESITNQLIISTITGSRLSIDLNEDSIPEDYNSNKTSDLLLTQNIETNDTVSHISTSNGYLSDSNEENKCLVNTNNSHKGFKCQINDCDFVTLFKPRFDDHIKNHVNYHLGQEIPQFWKPFFDNFMKQK